MRSRLSWSAPPEIIQRRPRVPIPRAQHMRKRIMSSQVGEHAHEEVGDDAGGGSGSDERALQVGQAGLAGSVAQAAGAFLRAGRGTGGGRWAPQHAQHSVGYKARSCAQRGDGRVRQGPGQHRRRPPSWACTHGAGAIGVDAGASSLGHNPGIHGQDVRHREDLRQGSCKAKRGEGSAGSSCWARALLAAQAGKGGPAELWRDRQGAHPVCNTL